MKRPSFLGGVALALLVALAAGAFFAGLAPALGAGAALRILIPATGLTYLLWLLRRSARPTGRITTFALWLLGSTAMWLFSPPLGAYVLAHADMLWLVRSLYFHGSLLPALLDLGLCALSVSAGSWAVTRSGSVFLATWCFFLVQAAFAFIPPARRASDAEAPDTGDKAFESARRRADAALRQLFTH
ncbi:MAG TPA: hypothetical protein VE175_02460 [Woeseiaceae bacterium]|jgi:hypothetical protein|nr:hypothetical protein [Woeseiaceae bacterium]